MIGYPQILTLVSAELVFVMARSADILIISKSKSQRTELEQHQVDRGLARSIILEALLFVPASAALILLIAPLLLPDRLLRGDLPLDAVYATIGMGQIPAD
jgi:hypothetical protein